MYRIFLLTLLSTCATAAFGINRQDVPGTYRLKISDQSLSVARTMGQPAPEGSLLLGPDNRFELIYRTVTETSHRFGTYFVDGSDLVFRFRNRNRQVRGTLGDGCVIVNGLEYDRPGWVAPPRVTAVFSPDPHPPVFVPAQAVVAPVLPPFNPVGTWSVRNHGVEDLTSRMTFDRNGNFSFSGHGASSKGNYVLHDTCITLVWTQIDDDAVEEGTVRKDVPICADHCGFDIDTYHYEKCSKG